MDKNKPIISISLLIIAVLVSFSDIDVLLLETIENTRTSGLNTFFTIFTHFGSYRFLVPFGLIVFLVFKNKSFRLPLSFGILFASIFNTILKYIVSRPRPNLAPLMEYTSYSFPSGHTMVNATFMYFLYKYLLNENKNFIPLLLLYSLLMGYSRLYLGVHYPSDIIGGYSAAFFFATIFDYFYEKRVKSSNQN